MIKRKIFRKIRKVLYRTGIIFLASVVIIESMFFGFLPGQRAPQLALASTTLTKTTQADFQAGKSEFNNIDTISSAGDIKLQQNLGSWDASGSASLNHYIYPYNKMLKIGKFMYLFKNRGIGQFLRYDFDTREYKELTYIPLQPYEIVDMTSNGTDKIWVFAGRTSNTNLSRYFLEYDIPTDTWTYLANTPSTIIYQVASLEYVGNDTIYALRGGNDYGFWRYTISTNTWDVIQNTTSYCQTYCDLIYDGSRYMYMATDWGAPDRLYRFDTTNRTWLQRANAPIDGAFSTAVDMVMIGDDIYTMRGGGTNSFYKYNTVSNTWSTMANLPYPTSYGSLTYDSTNNRIVAQIGLSEFVYYYISDNAWSNSMAGPTANAWATSNTMDSDGAGNFYFCRGQNTTTCYQYASATNTWTTLPAGPTMGYYGNNVAYYNNAFYINQGSNGNALYRYNVGSPGTWTTSGLAVSPAVLSIGSNMIASSSGTLWALQGNGGTGFYRYDIAGNSWTTKATVPQGTHIGSGMVQAGMFTYVLQGYGRGKLWRYHETTNGWYELASLPVGSYYGGGMTYDGGDYVYAQVGGETDIWSRQFYRYSISGNTWTRMADTPEMIRWGGNLDFYNGKIYSYQGYDGGFWKYTPPSGNAYTTTGNWYSPVYDLTTSSAFNTFNTTENVPAGTSITYYSRTSSNQNTWTDWQLIAGGLISSTPQRYIQIKAALTGDGTSTPTLSDFSIDYESDVTAPETGSISVLGYSASGGSSLVQGGSYLHRHPYFTWSGVTDTESGIDGYYVYFGDNASADPEASGSYQNTTNYTVATSMTSGTPYYLLIKAKDKLGNISAIVTGFTYIYSGISPATTTTLTTTQADWDSNEATKSAVYAGISSWWNQNYLYRKQLTISPISYIGPNTVVKLTLDTAALETAGKLRTDRKDWRVVYWDGNQFKEIDQDYVNTTTTYFVLQKGINIYSTDSNYYVYYGNAGEITSPLSNMGGEKGGAKWGGGQSFNGSNYVRIPSAINNQSKLTIEGWFKYKNANAYRMLYGDASGQVGVGIYSGQNYLTYFFRTAGSGQFTNVPGTTQLETGRWYHFAVTYDSTTGDYKTYVNGRLDYVRTGVSGNVAVTVQQYLGYSNYGYYFGFLDEFRISNNVRYTGEFTPPTTKFTTDANTLGLYHFDDDPGQTLSDSSGNNNNGTLGSGAAVDGGDPTWTSGTFGLLFDGTNDYVNLPVGLTTLINGKSNLTIEGWFRHASASGNRWLYGDGSTEQIAIGIDGTNNTMMYKFKTAGSGQFSDGTGSTVLTPGTWYHFATVYDSTSGTYKAYINGQSDYSRDSLSGNVSATNQERLGGSATGYFSGYLSEIRVSDIARYSGNFTPSSGTFLTDANTLALYHLTENVGQNINDSSGRGFTGYLGLNNAVASDDPIWWVGQINITVGTEESAPVTATDNGLTLESLNNGSWAGNQLPSMPVGLRMYYGASTYANNVLYVLRGYNTKTFYKLDLATSTWTQLADAPGLMYNGSSMVYDNAGNIYATQGQGYNLYKYNIATNAWSSSLTASTVLFSTGAVSTMVGTNTIYILAGASTGFLKYTISTDNWDNVSASPYSVTAGSGLYYDGTNTMWAVAGGGSSFAKYIVNTDTWDYTIPLAPYTLGPAANNLIFYNNYLYSFSNYDYQSNTDEKRYLWRYGLSNNKWESVPVNINFWTWTGATAYDGSRYAYLFQGYASSNASTAVARFDLLTNKFMPETPPLPIDRDYQSDGSQYILQPFVGTSLVYDGSESIYFALGNSTRLDKYNTTTKKWSMIPYMPCIYYGGGIVSTATNLYAVCGSNTMSMYRYNPTSLSWSQMADAPNTIQAGGSQVAVWDNADAIYVLRGNGTQTLYKYIISTNTWTTESSTIPATIGNSWGASITYDSSGNLFVVRGNDTNSFYKYNIASTTWTVMNNTPENNYYGSGSVYDNGKIYLLSGDSNEGFYVYDISGNSWTVAPSAMSRVYGGGAITHGPGNTLYALYGNYSNTFVKYNLPTATTSYKPTGTFTTKTFDLGNVYDWVGLTATVASPSATAVSFDTRTSTDSASWSDWVTASELKITSTNQYTYNINSTSGKYLQVRANLSSEESASTPTVSDISISYYKDETVPDNPITLESYATATSGASTINTNTWYNYPSPHFVWSGGTDATGSGVLGYYVYFGSDSNAIASLSGTLQTEASYSASLATDGSADGEYYLKIQAVDNGGNINPDVWSPFHYRYDKTSPPLVGTVSVDPRIYTKTNNFNMSWSEINDTLSNSTSSGLLGYYYQASSSANILNDNFASEASVSGILAYQEGSNTFAVRVADQAGNVSDYKTASFYFNETPPSAPVDLAVDTSNGGANKFNFTWSKPTTLKGSVKEYRYSVNNLPTADNTSIAYSTIVTNQKGTKSGTNTFYIVAVDEADNADYNNYASINFDVNITAPGTPLSPEAFDNSIRNTKSYRVGITWDKPTDIGSAFDRYEIYAFEEKLECSSLDMDNYKKTNLVGSTAGTSEGGSYVVTALNNTKLDSKDYYLCVLACSSNDQCSSPSTTVTMLPTGRWLVAPDMIDKPTATVKTKSAIVSWSTSRAANSFVKYGTKSGDYGNEVGSSEQSMVHTISLLNLAPGTTYYYKVLWSDEDGNQSESDEYTLTTTAAPYVSNVKFSNVNINSAYVTFTIKNATKATVQYGKSLSYGSMESISTSISETSYTIALANLVEGTTHHLRIAGEDSEANIYYSDDYTFDTLPTPKILNFKLQQVSGMATATLRLLWSSNTLISSVVTYYPTGSPERAIDSISLVLKKSHEVILKNLNDDTEYTLIVKGKDSAGNESQVETKKVKTSNDMRPPEIQNMNVESTIVGVGDSAKAQIVVSWDTDEPATTQVEYAQGTGTSYDQTTQEDSNLTTNHTVTITSLTPAKIYHLRANSKDKAGNIGQSFDTVIITPKSTKDALTLVIENLSKTFGFLNNLNIKQ